MTATGTNAALGTSIDPLAATRQGDVTADTTALDPIYRAGGVGIAVGALCSAFGGIWDIQWHEDVGPDTFFTAPHLFLYAGASIVGLTALAVVLACSWMVGRGEAPAAPPLVALPGRFVWAPVGFIIAGCGALTFLLFGLFDLWWHAVYGFDAVLDSPPHTGLGLADLISVTGCIAIGALLAWRARGAGQLRLLGLPALVLATGMATFLVNSASWQLSFADPAASGSDAGVVPIAGSGAVDGQLAFVGALSSLALVAVVSVLRLPLAATLTALLFTLICAASWLISAWATPLYAEAVGLYLRDEAFGFPRIVAVLPDFLLPAAVVIDLVVAWARRRALPVRRGVLLAGAAGMAVLALLEVAWPNGPVAARLDTGPAVGLVVVSAVIGAVAGWTGWKLGVVLGRVGSVGGSGPVAPESHGRAAVARAAATAALVTVLVGPTASAVEPVSVMHRELAQVGPYVVEVGFSEWPIRAERSLDIVFAPEGGIAGKSGTLTLIAPTGAEEPVRLVRHPRARAFWGLDIVALPEPGRWSLRFAISGPEGQGVGRLPITLLERPGPPVLVGWLPALALTAAMTAAVWIAWRRVRPATAAETWSWA